MQNHGLGMEYDKMCEDGRPVGAAGAGDAMAPTDFGKSVNPISARRHFMPTTLILASRIFRPSYSPGYLVLPKIPQIPHNLFGRSAQIGQNIWDIIEKSPYRASVVGA